MTNQKYIKRTFLNTTLAGKSLRTFYNLLEKALMKFNIMLENSKNYILIILEYIVSTTIPCFDVNNFANTDIPQ